MASRPSFEMSADTRFLIKLLGAVAIGETVSYQTLSAEIGRPVDGSTQSLRRARIRLEADENLRFGTIKNVGVKRLSDVEIVRAGGAETEGTRRRVRRTARGLACVANFSAMTPADQARHTTLMTINLMMADHLNEKSLAKIEAASHGRTSELPIRETLKALGFQVK